ncbi:MAG: phage tail protein [Alphaproteobacteria bacterium]|nr:phage tail protein [Alphaproteobacteria bacterium]
MSQVLMRYGDVAFTIDGMNFQQLQKTSRWRWQPQSRLGRTSVLQYTGGEAQTLILQGVVFPHYAKHDLTRLRLLGEQANPRPLVDGRGYAYGLFVLRAITENWDHLLSGGVPRRIAYTLELSAYGEDL